MQKKYKNPRKMFHTIKPLQRRRDIHGNIPIVIYSNTRPCTHAGSCYAVSLIILTQGVRGIITSSRLIRFGYKVEGQIKRLHLGRENVLIFRN